MIASNLEGSIGMVRRVRPHPKLRHSSSTGPVEASIQQHLSPVFALPVALSSPGLVVFLPILNLLPNRTPISLIFQAEGQWHESMLDLLGSQRCLFRACAFKVPTLNTHQYQVLRICE